MLRIKRRTKYTIFAVLILLVITGIWLYRTVYVSTGSALTRAESFLFTRMTVAQIGEQGSIRYFYVTNRQMTEDNEILRYRFGGERESQLKFGFSIPEWNQVLVWVCLLIQANSS